MRKSPMQVSDAILALTQIAYEKARKRLANGQDVTAENIQIVNRARRAIAKHTTGAK